MNISYIILYFDKCELCHFLEVLLMLKYLLLVTSHWIAVGGAFILDDDSRYENNLNGAPYLKETKKTEKP